MIGVDLSSKKLCIYVYTHVKSTILIIINVIIAIIVMIV
jgi:hypothetical protein